MPRFEPPSIHAPTRRSPERVILVGVRLGNVPREQVEEHLDELESLTRTAGGRVVARCVQERRRPDPASCIGRGKAEQLAERVREDAADLVVFDEDLSPAQLRELERILDTRVIDRSALILDIFAGHARTREARTQVQAAQLEYMLPRLVRRWSHLSRQEGGIIGMRGVGETQIEIDRRLIRRRLTRLKGALARLHEGRRQRLLGRDGLPRVAVVGYTNAGKSSLVNALTGADCVVEDRLFSTLDTRVRRLNLGGQSRALLIDTVGFLRKLPHHLIASFRSTLEEAAEADALLHVVDASHPSFEEHVRVTRDTIAELGGAGQPELLVFNKLDRVGEEGLQDRLRTLHPDAALISAALGWGLEELRVRLRALLAVEQPARQVTLPLSRQDLVHQVYELVQVTHQSYRRNQVVLDYRASAEQEGRLRRSLERGAGGASGRREARG